MSPEKNIYYVLILRSDNPSQQEELFLKGRFIGA